MAKEVKHTPGKVLAGIERQIDHFRADPIGSDATPADVLSVADLAAQIDAQRAVLLSATRRVLAWHDRQGGHGAIPPDVERDLRTAIARAEAQP